VKHYNRNGITPRLVMKLDMMKAYDSLSWVLIKDMMKALNFPVQFIVCVVQCISIVEYSIFVNGGNFHLFEGKSGARQGDPISLLRFVMHMQYLSRCLKSAGLHEEFKFHPWCKHLQITHLSFTDDIILFTGGDIRSVEILLQYFDRLSEPSGLIISNDKSDIILEESKGWLGIKLWI